MKKFAPVLLVTTCVYSLFSKRLMQHILHSTLSKTLQYHANHFPTPWLSVWQIAGDIYMNRNHVWVIRHHQLILISESYGDGKVSSLASFDELWAASRFLWMNVFIPSNIYLSFVSWLEKEKRKKNYVSSCNIVRPCYVYQLWLETLKYACEGLMLPIRGTWLE